MKRKTKILVIWVTASILLQFLFLWFVDSFYLKNRGTIVEVVPYEDDSNSREFANILIPKDASELKISFDGSHVAYVLDGKLVISDIYGDAAIEVISKNEKILYYRWLQDRNMVIYSYNAFSKGEYFTYVETYDIETELTRSYPPIENVKNGYGVESIELSPLTNMVYVNIKTDSGPQKVYRYDIIEELKYIGEFGENKKIFSTYNTDSLVFQNDKNSFCMMMDSSKKIVKFDFDIAVLDVDSRDRIFVGQLENEKVIKVLFGKTTDFDKKSFTEMKLSKPVLPEDITLAHSGDIFVNDVNLSRILNLKDNLYVKYKGKAVGVTDEGVFAVENNMLKFFRF